MRKIDGPLFLAEFEAGIQNDFVPGGALEQLKGHIAERSRLLVADDEGDALPANSIFLGGSGVEIIDIPE